MLNLFFSSPWGGLTGDIFNVTATAFRFFIVLCFLSIAALPGYLTISSSKLTLARVLESAKF